MSERVKCFRIKRVEPKKLTWKDGIGKPHYIRLDTNEEIIGLEPGAIFFHDEILDEGTVTKGPDGRSLIVILPDREWWYVDGPSYSNGVAGVGWARTGEIPEITAKPSIATKKYHGWLTEGWLEPA